ncbi:MAG: D-alanine--D-alanine ligase [Bacteroidales bacterium]|jgi:D-alanine-D-alanine ligase|nr:D-alanine--D-alanine ligase [Bacteroidales bacterium]MDD2204318.1 D-alanine--D-alanine ligase [Bacteroidales bacterium]MDD3913199.1 D-alanine--D-alanine ligase [Bacteroidales bacterium]MDD4633114.1 D-alanine--D-alanine ligase [Bacteroidales bacterium]
MNKSNATKNIALVLGGFSGEHDISVKSGMEVMRNIDKKYNVYPITISKNGWYYIDNEDNKYEVDKSDFSIRIEDKKITFDLAFPIVHGTPGEDGKLQGYFDLLDIPYTGCNMFASAVTFNKYYCKSIVSTLGVPVAKSVIINNFCYDIDVIAQKIGFPCFVKPNKNGSSIGISKVRDIEELPKAIENAFQQDDEVLVEEFIPGRELTCGVFRKNGVIIVLPVTEVIPKKEFFDYEAKYDSSKSDEITPANMNAYLSMAIPAYTNLIYEALNCSGVIRVDYIVNDTDIYFLEVNSAPGMSDKSIVPQQVRCYGMTITEFLNIIIDETFAKYESKRQQ